MCYNDLFTFTVGEGASQVQYKFIIYYFANFLKHNQLF